MLSFSDSQSFSVSGMSGYSNFSAYESSVSLAGGTFKVRWHMTVTLLMYTHSLESSPQYIIMCRYMKTAPV